MTNETRESARPTEGQSTTKEPTPSGSASSGAATSPAFGGLSIDFGGDTSSSAGTSAIAIASEPAPGSPGAAESLDGTGGSHDTNMLIVGSGPAGLTAAVYAARANLEPIVLAGSAPGGQLMLTSDVENYPGFPDGIQGPDLMAAMRAQAERFGARLIDVDIDRVDLSRRPFRIWARGAEYRAQSLVVATGASALWLGLENETRLRGRGVSACATCDGFFFRDREIAVVGGGDTALEEAIYLTRFASKVHMLVRRDQFRGSKIMVDRARAHPKIEIHHNVAVDDVMGDAKVEGLRLRDTVSGTSRELPMDGLFIAIGYRPNTEVFRDWLEVDEKGYLRIHDETGSAIDGVFIAGDVHDHRYRQAVTAAGDGCKAAIDAERWLEEVGVIEEAATATAW